VGVDAVGTSLPFIFREMADSKVEDRVCTSATRAEGREALSQKFVQSSHIVFSSSDSDVPSSDEAHSSGPPSSRQEQSKDQRPSSRQEQSKDQMPDAQGKEHRLRRGLAAPPEQVQKKQAKGHLDGPTWSVGAELHDQSMCSPCAWFWREKGCDEGARCPFCHMCNEEEFKARRIALNEKIRQKEQTAIDLRRAEKAGVKAARWLAAGTMDEKNRRAYNRLEASLKQPSEQRQPQGTSRSSGCLRLSEPGYRRPSGCLKLKPSEPATASGQRHPYTSASSQDDFLNGLNAQWSSGAQGFKLSL